MQDTIPDDVLPPDELLTDLYRADHVEEAVRGVDNTTQAIIFTGADDGDTAILTGEGAWTYGELRDAIDRAGRMFLEHGVEEGERVVVQLGNVPEFLISTYALQKINAVPVPTTPMTGEDDAAYLVEDSRATWAVTTEEQRSVYTGTRVDILTAPFDLDRYEPGLTPRGRGDDAALLLYSSGTTGKPKGTLKTHEELVADAEVQTDAWRMTPEDVVAGNAPLSFAMGYLVFGLAPFHGNATLSLFGGKDPNALTERVAQDQATILVTVPAGYNAILQAVEDADLSSLRICMTGGDELKQATFDAWKERFGLPIANYYGCTELLTIALYQDERSLTPGTNGTPPKSIDAVLFDSKQDDDREPSAEADSAANAAGSSSVENPEDGHKEGELAVAGPVRVRYWNNTGAQEAVVRKGYYCTGDIFKQDSGGEYTFHCRKDNLIMTAGYKVSANEVENALLQHPAVDEAAVIGVPDEVRGTILKAFVTADEAMHDMRGVGELQGFVKHAIAPYKYPRAVAFVDAIPTTDTGKVDRNTLQDWHETGNVIWESGSR